MIDAYGAAVMYLLCALLIWISYGGLYYLIKYGDEMRTGIDIGSSAVENNIFERRVWSIFELSNREVEGIKFFFGLHLYIQIFAIYAKHCNSMIHVISKSDELEQATATVRHL